MFPFRFFPTRYFARKYWAPVTGTVATSVGADLSLSWQVGNVVASDLDARWQVADAVGSNLTISYSLREVIPSDLDIQGEIRGTVAKSLNLRWRVGDVVEPPVVVRPPLMGGMDGWGRQLPLPEMSERVGANLALTWQTHAIAGASLYLEMTIFERVSGSLRLAYTVEQADYYVLNREFLYGEIEEDEVVRASWLNAA